MPYRFFFFIRIQLQSFIFFCLSFVFTVHLCLFHIHVLPLIVSIFLISWPGQWNEWGGGVGCRRGLEQLAEAVEVEKIRILVQVLQW